MINKLLIISFFAGLIYGAVNGSLVCVFAIIILTILALLESKLFKNF